MYRNSYLKWAGSKNKMLPNLLPILEKYKKKTLVEPFVGAGNVALNFDCEQYYLADANNDLVRSHIEAINNPLDYIVDCQKLFDRGSEEYYNIRDEFNNLGVNKRTAHFQYLNKHGFNGLCRYNKKGLFNVHVGTIKKNGNNVPVKQINDFSGHFFGKDVLIEHQGFEKTFRLFKDVRDCLIVCDPPYVPMGTSDINYTGEGFSYEDQVKLRDLARLSRNTVVICNHWNDITKELYADADEIYEFDVQRTISCKGSDRIKVKECVVVYKGEEDESK